MCSGKIHVDNFCLVEEGPPKKLYKIIYGIHGIRSFYLSFSITLQKKKETFNETKKWQYSAVKNVTFST